MEQRPVLMIKSRFENQTSHENGYISIRNFSKEYDFFYKGNKKANIYNTDRRFIEFMEDSRKLTVGNYSTDIGSGLGIGRYDYRPVSGADYESDFVYPDNSYYNGLILNYRNWLNILYSSKKYSELHKNYYGISASANIGDFMLGFTSSLARFSLNSRNRNLETGSIFIQDPRYRFKTEIAYAEAGLGVVAETSVKSLIIKGWHYSDNYLNPQSSGYAYPDYCTYHIFDLYGFRQSQSGETGVFFEQPFQWHRLLIRAAVESWITQKASSDLSLIGQYSPKESVRLINRFSYRGGYIQERFLYENEVNFRRFFSFQVLTHLWSQDARMDRQKSFSQAFLMVPLRHYSMAGGRIRFRHNGESEFYIEENTLIYERINLTITYKWRDSLGSGLGPFYLVLECVF